MILVADIGTTFAKAGLIDSKGMLLHVSRREIQNHLQDTNATENWVNAFSLSLSDIDVKHNAVDCIIISGNGPTLAPSQGGTAFMYNHNKAVKESDFILKKTGIKLLPSMFLPKALFIKTQNPELWKSTKYFLSSPEFISYTLTGKARTFMPLEGLEKWYWDYSILDSLHLEKEKFPSFIEPGEFLGNVNKTSALRFGLTEGTPVLAGCPDFVCAIIGSGAMHEGMICDRSGTSEGLNYCSSKYVDTPFYMCYRHPNGINWNISAVIQQSGLEIENARISTGLNTMSFKDMWNYIQLNNDEKSKLIKKVSINLCNTIKSLIDNITNGEVSEIRLTGGPSKSAYLNQLRANIIKTKISVPETEEAGLSGLGILALASLNNENLTKVADRTVKIKETYIPAGL